MPSGSSIASVVQSLNDASSEELAIPGNWSSELFFQDLKKFPVRTKKELIRIVHQADLKPMTYREFFQQTRGYPREVPNVAVWEVFDQITVGSIMLYFEKQFLKWMGEKEAPPALKLVEELAQIPIGEWNPDKIKTICERSVSSP